VGVTAGVIVLVRFLNSQEEVRKPGSSKSGPTRKPGSRPELRRDSSVRLAALTRRPPRRNGR
jgi:hypothetical protein